MKYNEEIKNLTRKIAEIETEQTELSQQAYQYRTDREALITKTLLEGDFLNGTTWEVKLPAGKQLSSQITIVHEGNSASNTLEPIESLARLDYQCWFQLEPQIEIRFDDGQTTIIFSQPKMVLPFIIKNKMNLISKSLSDRISSLKRELAAYEDMSHHIGV